MNNIAQEIIKNETWLKSMFLGDLCDLLHYYWVHVIILKNLVIG